MKIPWKEANQGSPVSEEQYQERFWRRRLDGVGLDMVNKEFLAIEFKRTRDARSNYVEKATAVAREQYTSLLTGLQAVGQVKGWKVQQLVFVCGTCGSVHVGSFNKNMKALGVLESKWDLIRQKLVRRLLEEQDKVLRSYFAQRGGAGQRVDPPRGGCYEPYNRCSQQYNCKESQRSRRPLSSSVQVEAQLGSGVRNRGRQSFCGRAWAKKDEKNVRRRFASTEIG
jgi:hypothetical protein